MVKRDGAILLTILLVQIAIPIGLLAWLSVVQAASVSGLAVQIAGIGAFLFALSRVAQWAVPVWWLPLVYGGLWLAAAALALGVRPGISALPFWPSGGWGWTTVVLGTMLMAVGVWFGGQALSGRTPPPVEVVDISNPFGVGHFLVASAGSHAIVNHHLRTLDQTEERFRRWH